MGLLSNHTNSTLSFLSHFNGFGNDSKDFTGFVNLDSICCKRITVKHEFLNTV